MSERDATSGPLPEPIGSVRAAKTARPASPSRIVAVGGGKGGSGKSLLATTLGIELARRGLRVVLVDCDLGGPNLHSLLCLPFPKETLSDFILRRVGALADLVVATPVPGLSLISGARNAIQVTNPMYQQKMRLIRAIGTLPADVAVLDLGAGSHNNVVDFFLLAHHGILVVVPEPTSVENTYRFLKAAFLRRIHAAHLPEDIRGALQVAAKDKGPQGMTPVELVRTVARSDPQAGRRLEHELADFAPQIVVNRARDIRDIALGEGVCAAADRMFGLHLGFLGSVRDSDHVDRAVRSRLPLVFENLGREFASDLTRIGDRLLSLPARPLAEEDD